MTTKSILIAFTVIATILGGSRKVEAQDFYVAPAERELLIYVSLSPSTPGPVQSFYNFVEFSAESLAQLHLGYRYGSVTVVKGGSATRSSFVSTLNALTSKPALRALDVLFVTHGLGGSVSFSDGNWSTTQLRNNLINGITSSRRAKLRTLFSTACYGSSHRSAWRDAGFKAVSGSRLIYADSALSYAPFLTSYAGYNRFSDGVNAANNADPLRVQDQIAKGILLSAGYSNWSQVDSFRNRSGWTTTVRVHRQIPGLQ